jgi:signal transduction histidine kinase
VPDDVAPPDDVPEEPPREQWLETLAGVATTLLSGGRLADVLPAVAAQARDIAGGAGAIVALPDDGSLRIEEVVGAEFVGRVGARLPVAGTLLDAVMHTREPVVVADLGAEAGLDLDGERADGVGPVVVIPLVTPADVRGVLVVYDLAGRPPFAARAVAGLRAFAAQVAVPLELAERRHDFTRLALLEERERIARDLHDVVIQRLFAIGLTLDAAAQSLPAADPTLAGRVGRAIDEIDETIAQIRTTIFGLQAAPVDGVDSLRVRVIDVARTATPGLRRPPRVHFSGPVDTTVPPEVAQDVVAVTREALANVARHADADHVEVLLSVADAEVALVVQDDGVGLPPSVGRRSGLANIAARARRHGGSVALRRREPSGTCVEWRVPLQAPP